MNLALRLQPKQDDLLGLCNEGTASWLGYGGARGGGKSAAARRIMLLRRLQYAGTWGMIFRRVRDDLQRNHIDKFFSEFPDLEKFYKRAENTVELPNKSKIIFGYAETYDDVKRKFHGPEYMDLFIDQAEQCTEQELLQMKMACRWPDIPQGQCKMVLFFNPGGVGMSFLKRVFHDRNYKVNKELGIEERAEDYNFIQAYGWDNVNWMTSWLQDEGLTEKDFYSWDSEKRYEAFIQHSDYGKQLNSLPQALRIGALLGNFDRFEGQYFAEVFDRDRQVIPSGKMEAMIRPWWSRWVSIDWGFAHHSAVYWHAKGTASPDELRKFLGIESANSQDVVFTYRELMAQNVGEYDLGRLIVHRTPTAERSQLRKIYLSPDAFAKRGSANTVAEQLGDVFLESELPRPHPADNDRVGGWRLCFNLLSGATGMLYYIGSDCPALCDAIPMAIHDADGNLEDVKKIENDPGDDSLDGWRYGIKSMLSGAAKPLAQVMAEKMAGLATPHDKSMMHRFLKKRLKAANRPLRLHA